jgi:hypothetical protein
MAIVQGIREKVHLPIYDSLTVEAGKQLREAEPSSILKFFVNVQKKTKLETNLQSASLLPHYNTFEARAMRVVISDVPPKFPLEAIGKLEGVDVFDENGAIFQLPVGTGMPPPQKVVVANIEASLKFLMKKLQEARVSREDIDISGADDPDNKIKIKLRFKEPGIPDPEVAQAIRESLVITLTVKDLEKMIEGLEKDAPPKEQIRSNNGSGTIIGKLIYNTVTTLYVGEKIMIQMPTWFFPSGAGPYSESASVTTHGEPSPTATFRFAEPIFIDKQQNFRVEIEIPDTDTLKQIQRIYGPMNLWVVLDGYMTRDVQ